MLYDKKKWIAIIFILPFVLFGLIFLIYPFLNNIWNMFFQFQFAGDPEPIFAGFNNFSKLFKDSMFYKAFTNTLILIVCVMVFQIGVALLLALLVDKLQKGSNIYRIIFFMPIVISATTLGTMLFIFSNKDSGLFNQLLAAIGIKHGTWLPADNRFASLAYVLTPIIWQYIGFYFVILLTGLANIDESLTEAAKLDGASSIQSTFYVILPMLQNVFRTCMVLAITGALKVFDLPEILAPKGGANGNVFFMGTYNSFLFNDLAGTRVGECAIFSVILVLMGITVAQLSNLLFKENKDI